MNTPIRLLITCPDKPGIVYQVTQFLFQHGANIVSLDQYSTDLNNGTFFMRVECQLDKNLLNNKLESEFEQTVAQKFTMHWQLSQASKAKRMAILVSKQDHAILELLWRWSRAELPIEIPMIISNHPDLEKSAKHFDVPFYHIPNTPDIKKQAESDMLARLQDKVDGIILARYMQILSPEFISAYEHHIINIHHSFLPAFVGASPYHQAYDKGVKLIGATAHYVTPDLDMGPIIAQDVVRVTHRLNQRQFIELGREVERSVLAKAVKWHAEDRIILHGHKTIVFEES